MRWAGLNYNAVGIAVDHEPWKGVSLALRAEGPTSHDAQAANPLHTLTYLGDKAAGENPPNPAETGLKHQRTIETVDHSHNLRVLLHICCIGGQQSCIPAPAEEKGLAILQQSSASKIPAHGEGTRGGPDAPLLPPAPVAAALQTLNLPETFKIKIGSS